MIELREQFEFLLEQQEEENSVERIRMGVDYSYNSDSSTVTAQVISPGNGDSWSVEGCDQEVSGDVEAGNTLSVKGCSSGDTVTVIGITDEGEETVVSTYEVP
jgi:hypothetical protein